MPENFKFYVEWGYSGSFYDSFSGTLKKAYGESTKYIMSEDELKNVYALIRDMKIERYDDELHELEFQQADPCMDIRLSVCAGKISKTVEAQDVWNLSGGKSLRCKRFFETVSKIVAILESTDEWKSLPPDPNVYY